MLNAFEFYSVWGNFAMKKEESKITIADELQVFLSRSHHRSLPLFCTNFADVQSCLIIHPYHLSLSLFFACVRPISPNEFDRIMLEAHDIHDYLYVTHQPNHRRANKQTNTIVYADNNSFAFLKHVTINIVHDGPIHWTFAASVIGVCFCVSVGPFESLDMRWNMILLFQTMGKCWTSFATENFK